MNHKIESIHVVGTPGAQRRHRPCAAGRAASTPMPAWTVFDEASVNR